MLFLFGAIGSLRARWLVGLMDTRCVWRAAMGETNVTFFYYDVESIMQDPNVQELIREWEDKGPAEGRAEKARSLLLKVLKARSLPVSPDVRARIEGEPDLARLESWLETAVIAATIGDVVRRDATVDPGAFVRLFAPDLSARQARVLAATQKPIAGAVPSWYQVSRADQVIARRSSASWPRGWARGRSSLRRATRRCSRIRARSPS
jgi:hypothetical protein